MRSGVARMLLGLVSALAVPALLPAQEGFLFRQPMATVSLRFGQALPRASGELYDNMRERFTLDTGDFASELLAGDVLFRVAPRVDVGVGFQWAESSVESESRDYTYGDYSPIRQTTRLRRVPVSTLLRFYPLPRGESLAQYAWVPARFTPFVGGGAGVLWYRLEQHGDFVLEGEENLIFENRYESKGTALAAHVLAGADYWVTPGIGITAEGRYTFASDSPGGDYDYSSMDLSGLHVTAGLSFRF